MIEISKSGPGPAVPDLTVCLTFDVDGTSSWVRSTSPAELSRGEFTVVAVPRVLDLLDRHNIKATFFVPGHTALAYPHTVHEIVDRGHEVGHHGWVHEELEGLDEGTQRDVFQRGLDALDRTVGVRPVGFRAPSNSYDNTSIDLVVENGFVYDSAFSASDFQPYYLRRGDRWNTEEPFIFGTTTEIVELPFAWHLDDWVQFEYSAVTTALNSPRAVGEMWQAELDFAYRHERGGVFVLTMHPEVIGRASRITMLESLIEHASSLEGLRFARMDEYAAAWKSRWPLAAWLESSSPLVPQPHDPTHSLDLRLRELRGGR
jgi:peptidoglycan/xylan/chitin deacetylase (PgdA/CDA1 family)